MNKFLHLVTNSPGIGAKPPYSLPPGIDSIDASMFIQNFLKSTPSLNQNSFPFPPGIPLSMDRSPLDTFPLASIQKQLLAEQQQKRIAGEMISNLPTAPSHVANYSNKNLSNIGGQQQEVNTSEMVIRVKSILAENNIAQKVFLKYYNI